MADPGKVLITSPEVQYYYSYMPWTELPAAYMPCPHQHFKSPLIDRKILKPEDHIALLSTPKGFRWIGEATLQQEPPSYTLMRPTRRKPRERKKLMEGSEQKYIHEFLAEIWSIMSPEMTNRLVKLLVEEFGLSLQEAKKFINEQSKCVQNKKKNGCIVDLDIRSYWLKEFRRLLSAKLTDYIVAMMCARRSKRTRLISEEILRHLCDITGEYCTLNNPSNRVQRIQVFIADRISAWLAGVVADSDKEICTELTGGGSVTKDGEGPEKKKQPKAPSRPKPKPSSKPLSGKGEGDKQVESDQDKIRDKDKKPTSGPGSKQASGPESKQASGPGSKQTSGPGSKQASGPGSKQASGPGSKQASGPGSKQASKPPTQPGSKQPSKPPSKPESKQPSKPPSKPESEQPSKPPSGQESKTGSKPPSEEPSTHTSVEGSKTEGVTDEGEEVQEESGEVGLDKEKEGGEGIDEEKEGEEELEAAGDQEDKKDAEGIVKEWIEGTTPEGTPREEAIEGMIKDELTKEMGDTKTDKDALDEAARKSATWVDKMVTDAEKELGKLAPPALGKKVTFHIKEGDTGCYYDVKRVDSSETCDKIKLARVPKVAPLTTQSICKQPTSEQSIHSPKEWAEWATGVITVAEQWVSWINKTCVEAEEKVKAQKEGNETTQKDWEKWKKETQASALEWKRNKKLIKETAKLWEKKVSSLKKGP